LRVGLKLRETTISLDILLTLAKCRLLSLTNYAWLLVNYLEPDQSGSMSEVHYIKVHCSDSVFRTLKKLRYDGLMGLANVADSFVPSNFLDLNYAKSGTAREAAIKNMCTNGLIGYHW
jgi:hypothetical protein